MMIKSYGLKQKIEPAGVPYSGDIKKVTYSWVCPVCEKELERTLITNDGYYDAIDTYECYECFGRDYIVDAQEYIGSRAAAIEIEEKKKHMRFGRTCQGVT